jgi:hypothetical protein
MTNLALAPAGAAAPAPGPTTAAELAARIPLPRQLPPRHDGEPIGHLSHSSYALWVNCKEAWRLRYLQGHKEPPSGSMFLGSRVDETLTHYYRHWLEHEERLGLRELKRFFGANWKQQLAAENDKLGVTWDERLDRHSALKLGVKALVIAFEQLVPQLGEPIAVQRRVECRLGPVEWTVEGYLDLETRRPMLGTEEPAEEIIDYKVKAGSAITETTAARNPAGQSLPRRTLARGPARDTVPVRADPDSGRPAQDARHIPRAYRTRRGRAAIDAREDRARRQRDRRLLPALRRRSAVGVRRPDRLEVLREVLPLLARVPGRRRPVTGLSPLSEVVYVRCS